MSAGGGFEGQWCPVAGTVATGEAPIDTARRELREETTLELSELIETGIRIWRPARAKGVRTHIKAFVGRVGGEATVVLNNEHTDFRWVSFEHAVKLVSLTEQKRVIAEIERVYVLGETASEFDYYAPG